MWEPYDPFSYFLHVGCGFAAVAGAIVALAVRKGSTLHKRAGWIFVIPMVVAAVTALIFEVEFDEPRPLAVVWSIATLYLLATSILALRSSRESGHVAEKILIVVPLVLFAFSAAVLFRSVISGSLGQIPGPALHAGIFAAMVIGDIRLILARYRQRPKYIRRHLFRMLMAFAFAIRALLSLGIEIGVSFEVVATTPILIALAATGYFFRRIKPAG